MKSTTIGAAVVVGCLGAAGIGAYLAVRQNEADRAARASVAALDTATSRVESPAPSLEPAPLVVSAPEREPASGSLTPPAQPRREPARGNAQPADTVAANRAASRSVPARATGRDARETGSAPAAGTPTPVTGAVADEPAARELPPVPVDEARPAADGASRQTPAAPAAPQFDEVVVAAEAVIGVQIDHEVSSETARLEDRVTATVTRDVRVGPHVAIPAGSRLEGSVVMVERGGRFQERARLGIRFHAVVFRDGGTLPIETETIYREGKSPAGESAAKVGAGAVGGAVLGAILGGGRGAAIGGAAGAGAGTAAVLAGGRNPAALPAGTAVTVRLSRPVTVLIER